MQSCRSGVTNNGITSRQFLSHDMILVANSVLFLLTKHSSSYKQLPKVWSVVGSVIIQRLKLVMVHIYKDSQVIVLDPLTWASRVQLRIPTTNFTNHVTRPTRMEVKCFREYITNSFLQQYFRNLRPTYKLFNLNILYFSLSRKIKATKFHSTNSPSSRIKIYLVIVYKIIHPFKKKTYFR